MEKIEKTEINPEEKEKAIEELKLQWADFKLPQQSAVKALLRKMILANYGTYNLTDAINGIGEQIRTGEFWLGPNKSNEGAADLLSTLSTRANGLVGGILKVEDVQKILNEKQ